MLFPSAFKIVHVLEKHKQNYCNENKTHIDQHELECSICDFKLNQNYYLLIQDFQVNITTIQKKLKKELYVFKYYHQHLSYSLRGPPELFT